MRYYLLPEVDGPFLLSIPGAPVSRTDLSGLVRSDYKDHKKAAKLSGLIITMAQYKMITTFGIELREIEKLSAEAIKQGLPGRTAEGQHPLSDWPAALDNGACLLYGAHCRRPAPCAQRTVDTHTCCVSLEQRNQRC